MFCSIKTTLLVAISLSILVFSVFLLKSPSSNLPVIAIANYGPHASLHETIQGIKDTLAEKGYVENQHIRYEILDANFEHTLIRQMLSKLKMSKPLVIIALSTPVAQAARSITDIPVIFSDITAPVEAGLLTNDTTPLTNMTGASDKQDLTIFLQFAQKILPHAKRIGLLYATTDANDQALVNMMQRGAKLFGMEVVLVGVEHANDVKLRMQAFKGKVDFIYVGVSGPIQPSLPTIASEALRMQIPVFNADANAVKQQQVLGSFGVSYYQVGVNTANMVAELLQGKSIKDIPPRYPTSDDHHGFLSKDIADKLSVTIPDDLNNITVVQ